MTMIIAAHLGDCILIAADKRSMLCNLETGSLRLNSDQEQKIKLWSQGAIVCTGETLFLNRVEQYFINYQNGELRQLDAIHEELERRVLEGVPIASLIHNTIIYSLFNGRETRLYSVPTAPFFNIFKVNGVDMVRPQINEIQENTISVQCFNIPPDMTSLQNFHRNMKPLKAFIHDLDCINYYMEHLKEVFASHARIDPSITTSFDLYLQSCETGESVALHVTNPALATPIPKGLNYWEHKKNGPP